MGFQFISQVGHYFEGISAAAGSIFITQDGSARGVTAGWTLI